MAASASRPLSQQGTGQNSSELTDWVNTIAARATAAAGYSTQSVSELQDEVRRAREERHSRRGRLSAGGVKPLERTNSTSESSSSYAEDVVARHVTGSSFRAGGPISPNVTGGAFETTMSPSHDLIAAKAPAFPTHTIPKSPTPSRLDSSSFASSPSTRAAGLPQSGATSAKGAALLARYGGAAGPTGVASGPSAGGGPVSLANFMGGKASGPRLGKLVGDGRSAPPEAALAVGEGERDSRGRPIALPGLAGGAPSAGAGLASFMKDHLPASSSPAASGIGSRGLASPSSFGAGSPISRVRSRSPEKKTAAPAPSTSPVLSAASTTTYKRSSANLSFPRPASQIGSGSSLASPVGTGSGLLSTSPTRKLTGSSGSVSPGKAGSSFSWSDRGIPSATGASTFKPLATSPSGTLSTSPVRALGGLPATNPVEAAAPRAPSPSKPVSTPVDTATSPAKPSLSLPTTSRIGAGQTSPVKSSAPVRAWTTPASPSGPPANADSELPAWKAALIANRSSSGGSKASGMPSASSTSGASPAFATSHIDRAPTASLTRLSAKKMVGQRLAEAEARQSSDGTNFASTKDSNAAALATSPGLRDRWPTASFSSATGTTDPARATSPSETTSTAKSPRAWAPGKIATALPGLAGLQLGGAGGAARPVARSPEERSVPAADDRSDLPPVRLPGMGGAVSPFAARPASPSKGVSGTETAPIATSPTAESPSKASFPASPAAEPLASLTKGRAKGPRRTTARTISDATAGASEPIASQQDGEALRAAAVTPMQGSHAAATTTASAFKNKVTAPQMPRAQSPSQATQRSASPVRRSPSPAKRSSSPVKAVAAAQVPSASQSEATPAAAAPAKEAQATPPAPRRSTSGKKVVVLISGSGSNLQALIDATTGASPALPNAYISNVISNRKAAFGLTRASTSNPPIPTHVLALKTWQNKNPGGTREQYDEVLARTILEREAGSPPDLIVLAGFMHIVSEHFLRVLGHNTSLPPLDAAPVFAPVPIINLHPAKPGAFDGAHAIERAFAAFQEGKITTTGVMVHEVIAEVDRGQPVLVREVPIYGSDTIETLEERMHRIEHEIIVEGARVVLERPPQPMSAPNPWDDVEPASEPARASSPAKQGALTAAAAASDEVALAPSTPARSGHHSRDRSEDGVNEKPQFSSVKDALANWSSNASPSQASMSVIQPRPRRRTASRPQSMYASKESTLAAVQERPSEAGSMRGIQSPPKSPQRAAVDLVDLRVTPTSPSRPFDPSVFRAHEAPPIPVERTISVDVLSVNSDGTTTPVPASDAHILHDTELHCIVHRFKGPDSLASTKIYMRWSRKAQEQGLGGPMERKVQVLSKRYSCQAIDSSPGLEPSGLSTLLGGVLVTRQGPRQRFDASNTQLYLVRADDSNAYIDQVDLHTSNLSSGHSAVASLLGKVLVWHGRGSLPSERELAERFAKTLAAGAPVVQEEGREESMFWAFFDQNQPYASSCLHAHRASVPPRFRTTQAWAMQPSGLAEPMQGLSGLQPAGIYIVALPLEIFVLIGAQARSRRQDIRSAVDFAQQLSGWRRAQTTVAVPQAPVHCIAYPSTTPRDLACSVRFWSDAALNNGSAASFMNLTTAAAAVAELSQTTFPQTLLEDPSHLPIGISPELL